MPPSLTVIYCSKPPSPHFLSQLATRNASQSSSAPPASRSSSASDDQPPTAFRMTYPELRHLPPVELRAYIKCLEAASSSPTSPEEKVGVLLTLVAVNMINELDRVLRLTLGGEYIYENVEMVAAVFDDFAAAQRELALQKILQDEEYAFLGADRLKMADRFVKFLEKSEWP
ncbi:hypothetical protein LTR62_005664 [Meristemomyces frigidus]|uniref:Uncharacterized protein n=1 Tax=Meristemomyces frigidus TaxID=1508187 RepID=A0AAN7TP99_9PEZI|nr:hypothetical protein LTR62_005664 [Meristemomyces frigidus]